VCNVQKGIEVQRNRNNEPIKVIESSYEQVRVLNISLISLYKSLRLLWLVNSSASEGKLLFDQHKGSDGLGIESCMTQRDCIMASRKNPFDSNSRSCIEPNEKERVAISCELTRNWKNIPCKTREVRELWTVTSPLSQWITSIKIFTRELEVLLNLVCERLRKVSVARCEIDLLRRVIYYKGWCYRSWRSWEWFIILGTEMSMKILFGSLKVGMGIQIVTTVCKKATI
jgi:hypothetical protein